jgi:hypothetical protein
MNKTYTDSVSKQRVLQLHADLFVQAQCALAKSPRCLRDTRGHLKHLESPENIILLVVTDANDRNGMEANSDRNAGEGENTVDKKNNARKKSSIGHQTLCMKWYHS